MSLQKTFNVWPGVANFFALYIPKPSLKIATASAICCNSLGLFRDYGLNHIFFRNKTFLFYKIENWNFQHLFEKEFRENSHNFKSLSQPIEKMIVSAFYLEKQKSFIPKKDIFWPR